MPKVLFTATVDSHIKHFHLPYLKWFQQQGYEVHVATNGVEEISYCDKKHTIRFERSPFKTNNFRAIKQLKKIIEEEKFDIIHCHTPMGSVVTRLSAMKAREKYNTKVIYTAHGFHFFKGASFLNWVMYYPVEKMLAKVTDCLITINKEDYNLAKKKFKTKQIELVHGVGVDPRKFDFQISVQEKTNIRKSLGLEQEDFVIIYPAELNKNKNQKMLLKVIAMLKKEGNKKIKVLLPGKDSFHGKYKEMAKKLGIESEIKFLGYRSDIPQLLKISDLSVSTSKREGLPINLIEAKIAGLPVIATNCRGNRDVVGRENIVSNQEELKEKIQEVMQSKKQEEKESMKEYYLENVLEEYKKIYERIEI